MSDEGEHRVAAALTAGSAMLAVALVLVIALIVRGSQATHFQPKGGAPMTTWTADELARIEAANELAIALLRHDGTLRDPVTIWVIRHGDDLYIRSVRGPSGSWFRGAQAHHEGHIEAGGVERDVTFVEADHNLDDEIDAAYRSKYSHSPSAVSHITSPEARSTTLKLLPRSSPS